MAPNRKKTTKSKVNGLRKGKLENYLNEFDKQVQERLAQMEIERDRELQNLDDMYRTELLKIPQHIRDLNWLEFLRTPVHELYKEQAEGSGNVATSAANKDNEQNIQNDDTSSIEDDTFAIPNSPPPKKVPKKGGTTVKKTVNKLNAKVGMHETPLQKAGSETDRNKRMFTPLNARQPHLNELLFSAKGSPVVHNPSGTVKKNDKPISAATVTINDQLLHVTASPTDISPSSMPKIDQESVQNLESLQKKLSKIIKANK